MPSSSAKPRRFLRFSLRALLLLTVVIGVPLGWLGRAVELARQERRAVATLREMGCGFQYHEDYESPSVVQYALELLGEDQPWNVSWIAADERVKSFSDADMVYLPRPTHAQIVWLNAAQITDAGLSHLQEMTEVMWLELQRTRVTDAGLAQISGLTRLKYLNLSDTQVTDKGLLHLRGMLQLRILNLQGTAVTEAGMQELKAALPGLGGAR